MEVGNLSSIDHDEWTGKGISATALWNEKEIKLMNEDWDWDISNQFFKAQLIESSDYAVCMCNNTILSTTTQSVGGGVEVNKDQEGTTSASASAHYQITSKDDKGNSDTLKVEGRGKVDEKGQTSAQATIKYEKTF